MHFLIKNIQYHPNDGPVAVYFEHDSPNPLIRNYVNLKQEDVAALAPAGQQWGDEEILTAARVQLALDQPSESFTLDYPPAPAPPPAAEGAGE